MARPAIKAPASEGICSFCQSTIDKGQMTRHLKSCKERKRAIEKAAATSSEPEVKLFHILVEGQYAPRSLLEWLLLQVEDRSLYVPLQRVLKVGQKFSHEYDFGSTTHLSLKVMAEREGHIQEGDDPITILARNVPPTYLCRVCGKPATEVASDGYYDDEEEPTYCKECARKKRIDTLPVVNSPRMGVCGYTGDAAWEGVEEWDDEEEDEE